ncbi:MAG: hypothetical protein WCP53_09845, partial [Verrucomicrobiota bacterium]
PGRHDDAVTSVALMTGEHLDAKDFGGWWGRNQGGRERVWFWQQRLHRDLAMVSAVGRPEWKVSEGESIQASWSRYEAELEKRYEVMREAVGKELETLPAEIELKVRLLAMNPNSRESLLGRFKTPRVSSERLLELLERKGLWEEMDLKRGDYNRLVVQILGQAGLLFGRKDVARLRAIQAREQDLWLDAQERFVIEIARLLPPASMDKLDDPDTWDGVLRREIRRRPPVETRTAAACELAHTGLPRNWDFLAEQFFSEQPASYPMDLRERLLQVLGSQPPTKESKVKREALASLLLDQRFGPIWTVRTTPRGPMVERADDGVRQAAFRAVNMYAGKEVLGYGHSQKLADPANAAQTLIEVKKIVSEVLAGPGRE